MARLNSYHLPPEAWPAPGVRAILDGPEARHLIGVLRARVGDTVRLFDGLGRHGLFQLAATTSKSRAELSPLSETLEPQPTRGVALALGWNKASRRDWLLEKGVELGALGFVFWQAVRSQGDHAQTPKEAGGRNASRRPKQCHAAWVPEHSLRPAWWMDFCALRRTMTVAICCMKRPPRKRYRSAPDGVGPHTRGAGAEGGL
jgi:16S rRNA (uracil1498-N3)-methyltransferase